MATLAPLICVADVKASSDWYCSLLNAQSGHGGTEYERINVGEQLLLQLHRWEIEHDHGPLGDPSLPHGNGVILWFELQDFTQAVERARVIGTEILHEPRISQNGNCEIWIRDLDGYTVVLTSPL